MDERVRTQLPSVPASPTPVDGYFLCGRQRVIGLITAAVVGVGVLGGLAGIAFDPEPASADPVTQQPAAMPGLGGGLQGPPATAAVVRPTSLASAVDGGRFASLGNGEQFFVPDGWKVDFKDRNRAFMSNGHGSYAFVATARVDPGVTAASLILDNLATLLPQDNYTQLNNYGTEAWGEPFGSVLSTALLRYDALWVDHQGSSSLAGQIYAGVRRDGTGLVHIIEHLPAEDFNDAYRDVPIVTPTFARFGGVA